MKKLFIIFILILSIFNHTFAFEVKLESSSDTVEIGDTFSIKIDIYSDGNISIEDIKASGISDFDVIGQSSSTSTRIINGKGETFLSYNYQLLPKKNGIYQIGPFEITANGQTKKTKSISVEVIGSKKENSEKENNIQNKDFKTNNKINLFYILVILTIFVAILVYLKNIFYLNKAQKNNLKKDDSQIETKEIIEIPKNTNLDINNLENAKDIIFEFLKVSFGKDFSRMTFSEVIDFLKQNNYDDYKIKELQYIFDRLNIYFYSKNKQIEDVDLINKIKTFVGR